MLELPSGGHQALGGTHWVSGKKQSLAILGTEGGIGQSRAAPGARGSWGLGATQLEAAELRLCPLRAQGPPAKANPLPSDVVGRPWNAHALPKAAQDQPAFSIPKPADAPVARDRPRSRSLKLLLSLGRAAQP